MELALAWITRREEAAIIIGQGSVTIAIQQMTTKITTAMKMIDLGMLRASNRPQLTRAVMMTRMNQAALPVSA